MKQRLITAAIGLSLFFVIMCFFDTFVYNIAMSVLAILAVYELLVTTKYVKNKSLIATSLVFAGVVPFLRLNLLRKYSIFLMLLFVMLLFFLMLFHYQIIRFEQIGVVFFVAVFFPFALASLVYIRDQFQAAPNYAGIYYTFLIFACAWGADAGAYFIGRFFGKKKLAPEISPHKTVEGFWGGFLGSFFFMGLITFIYVQWVHPTHLCLWYLIPVAIIGTLLSVFGDLSASIIKRQCSLKDFGNIIPGHGGVVDRFDSVFFVAPFFYAFLQFMRI